MSEFNEGVNLHVMLFVLLSCAVASQSVAENINEKSTTSEKSNKPMQSQNEQRPSLEMLEYLGLYMAEQGEWVDPMEVEEMTVSNKANSPAEQVEDQEG